MPENCQRIQTSDETTRERTARSSSSPCLANAPLVRSCASDTRFEHSGVFEIYRGNNRQRDGMEKGISPALGALEKFAVLVKCSKQFRREPPSSLLYREHRDSESFCIPLSRSARFIPRTEYAATFMRDVSTWRGVKMSSSSRSARAREAKFDENIPRRTGKETRRGQNNSITSQHWFPSSSPTIAREKERTDSSVAN